MHLDDEVTQISAEDNSPRERCRRWVERVVVGLGLCPFAAPVIDGERLRFAVCEHADLASMLHFIVEEIDWLEDLDGPQTTLVIFPSGIDDFERFLDLVAAAEDVIEKVGKSTAFQLAHFHPDYVFAGTEHEEPSNLTNRSPAPMLHLLRCEDVAEAVAQHPDPDGIPQRNIDLMRNLGVEGIRRLFDPV